MVLREIAELSKKIVKRFHDAKDHSATDQQRIESYERILSDMKDVFEITDEQEFKRKNRLVWDIYDAIRYEKEELENALVRN